MIFFSTNNILFNVLNGIVVLSLFIINKKKYSLPTNSTKFCDSSSNYNYKYTYFYSYNYKKKNLRKVSSNSPLLSIKNSSCDDDFTYTYTDDDYTYTDDDYTYTDDDYTYTDDDFTYTYTNDCPCTYTYTYDKDFIYYRYYLYTYWRLRTKELWQNIFKNK